MNSVQLVAVYYDGGDSESYAPDRAYISAVSPKTGALTICLECDDEGTSYLTLFAQRSAKAAMSYFGEHIVRIVSQATRIDLHVISAEAQRYWVEALACDSQPGEPRVLSGYTSFVLIRPSELPYLQRKCGGSAALPPSRHNNLLSSSCSNQQLFDSADTSKTTKVKESSYASTFFCEPLKSAPAESLSVRVSEV